MRENESQTERKREVNYALLVLVNNAKAKKSRQLKAFFSSIYYIMLIVNAYKGMLHLTFNIKITDNKVSKRLFSLKL